MLDPVGELVAVVSVRSLPLPSLEKLVVTSLVVVSADELTRVAVSE